MKHVLAVDGPGLVAARETKPGAGNPATERGARDGDRAAARAGSRYPPNGACAGSPLPRRPAVPLCPDRIRDAARTATR